MDSPSIKVRLRSLIESGEPPLDEACLLLCCLAGRDVEVPAEMRALDMVAEGLDASTFDGIVAGLFSGPQPLRGNTEAYYSISNSLLTDVRRTGMGIPISLSVLAMEIGRRKDIPVLGIGMPGHFLLGDGRIAGRYADPFNGVRVFGPEGARELFQRFSGGAAAWNDAFLLPSRNVDILFRVVNNIRVACTRQFAERHHLPWVLEVLSWFPQGPSFDPRSAAKAVAPFN